MNNVSFDDLDDFDTAPVLRERSQAEGVALALGAKKSVATIARFPCTACRGSGKFYGYSGRLVGDCFRCRGTGKQKTDGEAAARKRVEKAAQERAELAERVAKWKAENSAEWSWIDAKQGSFDFANTLFLALQKWGSLTEGQLAAVRKCIASDAERAKARAERKPDADVSGAGFTRMIAAFAAAKLSGLKYPKFRVAGYTFSLAGASSANAGSLYVKRGATYVGKVSSEGAFFASRDASGEDKAEVARIGLDPLAAAVMHGKQTGNCSCCGRELENEESVRLGIGPICREKWGLA